MGATVERDLLVVYPVAFRRDSALDDFSLEAIIAHERGHQLICQYARLRRAAPKELSQTTEEVLAALVGSVIIDDASASEDLVLQALFLLTERGMHPEEASGRVQNVLKYLETVL